MHKRSRLEPHNFCNVLLIKVICFSKDFQVLIGPDSIFVYLPDQRSDTCLSIFLKKYLAKQKDETKNNNKTLVVLYDFLM